MIIVVEDKLTEETFTVCWGLGAECQELIVGC
jgi:hypothetical protein